jgi:hypothetical protein
VSVLATIALLVAPGAARSQDSAQAPVQVQVKALGDAGVAGIALLTPSADGAAIQVLVVGAPARTTAVVHPGTCDAPDAVLVALLGDVGASGQIQATVPVPFETLTDGAHTIALHAGLDMSTPLGCGLIPAVVAPVPDVADASPAPGPDGATETFEGTAFDFSVSWAQPWRQVPGEATAGQDVLQLTNETSDVFLTGHEGFAGDALACVSDWERRVFESLRAGRISSVDRAAGPDGVPVSGGDSSRARSAFRYTVALDDGTTRQQTDMLECRRLSANGVLETLLVSPAESFSEQLPQVEALLAGLVLAEVTGGPSAQPILAPSPPPAPPSPQPSEAAAPTPVSDPTAGPTLEPTPEPTPDAACLGVEAWIATTEGRITRINEALSDLNSVAGRYDLPAYLAGLASLQGELQVMAARQAQDAVPGIAAEVNANVVNAYETYIDAARQIYESMTTSVDVATYSRAMGRYDEATKLMGEVQRAVGELKGRCTIG